MKINYKKKDRICIKIGHMNKHQNLYFDFICVLFILIQKDNTIIRDSHVQTQNI
jgi:hypothetical protein